MRIIAGQLGGRQFASPHGHRTHPMSEKMRGALFATLGDVTGLTVLDAFAGSGALGFEAISRGAAQVVAVDNDKSAQLVMAENIVTLGVRKSLRLIKGNVSSWSDQNPSQKFDLVLCDPPYGKLQTTLLQKLVTHVAPGGLYILSWPGKAVPVGLVGLAITHSKSYGDSQLVYYRHTS